MPAHLEPLFLSIFTKMKTHRNALLTLKCETDFTVQAGEPMTAKGEVAPTVREALAWVGPTPQVGAHS
jgi:hypothetical protein